MTLCNAGTYISAYVLGAPTVAIFRRGQCCDQSRVPGGLEHECCQTGKAVGGWLLIRDQARLVGGGSQYRHLLREEPVTVFVSHYGMLDISVSVEYGRTSRLCGQRQGWEYTKDL